MDQPEFIRETIPLAPQTTIRLGGPARYFAECTTVAQIRTALEWAASAERAVQILGGGSNVLFSDRGYDGLVLKIALGGVEFSGNIATVAAGESWDLFVHSSIERGLAGIECLSGIPGLAGATPIQNVGAYGQEVQETIVAVQALDRQTLEQIDFSTAECGFAYRHSRFKAEDRDRFIITAVKYRLDPRGLPQIRYPELRRELGDELAEFASGRPALVAVRNAVLKLRRRKSMVIDPQDPNSQSVGSFFLNPLISRETFAVLERKKRDIPHFPAPDGIKLPAAWLVENAGFNKGFQRGGIGISKNHALALINCSGSTREILDLADEIQKAVQQTFGIRLEREPVLIAEEI